MISVLALSLYFVCLISFSFSVHPLVNCLLLLFGALGLSFFAYTLIGFSWYLLMFSLVYIGGVVILFVFVSIFNPNPFPLGGGGCLLVSCASFFFFLVFNSVFCGFLSFEESGHYLCSSLEGFSYCFFCVVLLLGFSLVSLIHSGKDSFFR